MGFGKLLTRPARRSPTEARVVSDVRFGSGVWPDRRGGYGLYQGALTVPGAWRAATMLADLLGGLPWHAYRERAGLPVERLDPTPPLLEQPHYPHTRMATMSSWALDLMMHGNAVGVFGSFNSEGWPTSVVPVPARRVGIRYADGASRLPTGEIEYDIDGLRFSAAEVLHVQGPSEPGDLRGRGVLEVHLDTVDLAREQSRQARSLSQHGVPTGTLKSSNDDLTREEAREIKAAWLTAQRERTVAVLNSTTEFQALSWNPEELQLVEARKFSLHELALIFGVPPYFLGVEGGSMTYSNVEQEGLNLIKFTLGAHLARFEQALSAAFPRGTRVKANTDSLLRADTLTRYRAHGLALDRGFLTVDEVRSLEDRPPLTPDQREAALQQMQAGRAPRRAGPGGLGEPEADNDNDDLEES